MEITFDPGSEALDELMKPKKVSSKLLRIADLNGFDFVGDNLLARKSERDLWRLQPDGSIERLFEASDDPLEG